MEISTGHYLNLFEKKGADVFLIFNEVNREPTVDEIEILSSLIEREMNQNVFADRDQLREVLEKAVDMCNLECIEFGFQIVIVKMPSSN